jgi:hypothetical protein
MRSAAVLIAKEGYIVCIQYFGEIAVLPAVAP